MSGSMRSRKSEISPKCLTPTCLTTTHRLTHRRRSHATGPPALKTDFFGQQMLRAQSPYAITFRQSITKPRRKGSVGIRSGQKAGTTLPKALDLRPYRGQANYSLITKQQGELENSRRKARTPSPTFFSSIPRAKHSPKAKEGKGKKEGNRISMENVLQTPGEDEQIDNSAAVYINALDKSLEQYLSYQPAAVFKTLQIPASPTATRGSQVEPEPSNQGPNASIEPSSFTYLHPHRRIYLSSEVAGRNRSLAPTPPCS